MWLSTIDGDTDVDVTMVVSIPAATGTIQVNCNQSPVEYTTDKHLTHCLAAHRLSMMISNP